MTTANVYAERRDLYKYGLPRGTLGANARELGAVTASTDVLELGEHGFENDDEVLFRAIEGGTLAAPLVAGTTYFAIRLNDATFKVAATAGGAPINLTTDGSTMMVAAPLPFDEVLEFYSRFVDGAVPHLVPFTAPVPIIVRATVAKLSAKELQRLSGQTSVSMAAAEAEARTLLESWGKGQPVRDARATEPANLAITATDTRDSGWGSGEVLP